MECFAKIRPQPFPIGAVEREYGDEARVSCGRGF